MLIASMKYKFNAELLSISQVKINIMNQTCIYVITRVKYSSLSAKAKYIQILVYREYRKRIF